MSQDLKIFITIGVITLLLVGGGIFFLSRQSQPSKVQSQPQSTAKAILPVTLEGNNVLGPKDAKVTVDEFTDFQCPACGAAFPVVKQLIDNYKDKVRFVIHNFPLPMHQFAKQAAYAVEAAGEQGKFWEMHDLLFENQSVWSQTADPQKKFEEYAKSLGLNLEKFRTDMQKPEIKARIEKSLADGQQAQVDATPTFFINGEKFVGGQPYETFKTKIDSILASK